MREYGFDKGKEPSLLRDGEALKIMAVLCKDIVDNIVGYIDRELDLETMRLLESHIGDCPECRVFLETYKKMLYITGKLRERSSVSPEVRERLKSFLISRVTECD